MSPCECEIGPQGSISHAVNYTYRKETFRKVLARWEDNIKLDLKEIGVDTSNCVDSAQDRDYWRALVNVALNLRVS